MMYGFVCACVKRKVLWLMVFNATFNNTSVISWPSILLVEKTKVPGENHRPVASHWQTFSHNVISSTLRYEWGSNSQCKLWQALIAQVIVNPPTIWSGPRQKFHFLHFNYWMLTKRNIIRFIALWLTENN